MARIRLLLLTALCLGLVAVLPGHVATAPPDPRLAALRGACYCRAQGELNCVGILTQAECNKQCAESFCDDWFWMERLTCWSWGYGG